MENWPYSPKWCNAKILDFKHEKVKIKLKCHKKFNIKMEDLIVITIL